MSVSFRVSGANNSVAFPVKPSGVCSGMTKCLSSNTYDQMSGGLDMFFFLFTCKFRKQVYYIASLSL